LRTLADATEKYADERKTLNDAIAKLRKALHMTKESLKSSESEKQKLKDEKLVMRILLEHVRDVHNLSITIPE
jgi:mRNA-degrading endonuclease HigB of HigAB toxin-antitoxin module